MPKGVGVPCERSMKAPAQVSLHRVRGRECLRELRRVSKGVGVQCELYKSTCGGEPAQVLGSRVLKVVEESA